MKYKCDAGHEFIHTAKLIKIHHSDEAATQTIEMQVCPYCLTIDYQEFKIKDTIVSVISTALSDVDSFLKDGYEVESLYAKTATLVKKEIESSD